MSRTCALALLAATLLGGCARKATPPTAPPPPETRTVAPVSEPAKPTLSPEEEEKRRQEAFRRALEAGKARLAARDYAAARASLQEALKINPMSTEAKDALREAQKGFESVELARKKEEFQKRLEEGRKAFAASRYAEAIRALTEATRLMPEDRTARDLLTQAIAARVRELVAGARKDVEAGKLDAASASLTEAQKLSPKDPGVVKALTDLEAARARARAAKVRDLIAEARRSLEVGKLDAAAASLAQAQKLDPRDPGLVKTLDDLGRAREMATAAQVAVLVANTRRDLGAGKLDAAAASLAEAQKLSPKDPAVLQTQADLDAARAKVKAARVRDLVASARKDMEANRLDAAGKTLAEAQKLEPKNTEVVKALSELEKRRKSAVVDDKALKQRRADFELAMGAGRSAMKSLNYHGGINAFTEALRLFPMDRDAAAALDGARASQKEEHTRLVKKGQAALDRKQYADAVKAFSEAQKVLPRDEKTTKALEQARFHEHLAQGHQFLGKKRFAEAARAFEDALKIQPDSKEAKDLLKRAKDKKP
jgi:tetratricopeptide (TPR) repeat protein